MKYKYLVVGLAVGLILGGGLADLQAEENPTNDLLGLDTKSQQTISISSDRAELDNKQHTAVHRGNVVVKRGDVTLYSNEIESWFDEESKRIKRIEARGEVKLVQADITITAERATYFDQQQKVVLSGKPVCKKGDNVLTGSQITYFMDTGRIVVEDAKSTIAPKPALKTKTQAISPLGTLKN